MESKDLINIFQFYVLFKILIKKYIYLKTIYEN